MVIIRSSTMSAIRARDARPGCHACLRPISRRSSVSYLSHSPARRLTCRVSGSRYHGGSFVQNRRILRNEHLSSAEQQRPFSSASTASSATPASSVSPAEVAHFSRLASSWWDPHGPSRLLHLMNPLRHDFIRSSLSVDSSPNQKRLYLDIGCGGGIFASSAARLPDASTVTAIDPTPECIAVAQEKQRSDPALQSPKLTYLNCAIEDLPSDVADVDVLTLFEVIEHVPSPSTFLDECAKHVKPGGWIIGSTIARSPVSYLTTKLIAEAPLVGVVPRGTHDWEKYINPEELRGWFEGKPEGQWGDFRVQGVVYLPLLGWKVVQGSESFGNYFFGIQKFE